MKNQAGEEISAFVDGELGDSEKRFLSRRIAADAASRDTLARYQTLSAAMRGEYVPGAEQLADRVSAALDAEPEHAGRPTRSRWQRASPWLQPLGGVAIAASVAMGVFTVGPMLAGVGQSPDASPDLVSSQIQASPADGALERVGTADPSRAPVGAVEADRQRRLNAYFVNHSEHAAGGQLGGTLKYARIVGHGNDE